VQSLPRFFESSSAWLCEGILPTNLEWLRGLNALRVLAQGNAAEQIVGPERRERVSHQTWCGEGWVKSRRPVNSDVMLPLVIETFFFGLREEQSCGRSSSGHSVSSLYY
jgi:hypothetical protein